MQKGEFFVTGEVFLLDIGLLMGDIGFLMGGLLMGANTRSQL